jgi:hypothetical protein
MPITAFVLIVLSRPWMYNSPPFRSVSSVLNRLLLSIERLTRSLRTGVLYSPPSRTSGNNVLGYLAHIAVLACRQLWLASIRIVLVRLLRSTEEGGIR